MATLLPKLNILPPMPSVGDLLRIYNVRAAKQLSQNFLLNDRVCQKIVRKAGSLSNSIVCEVGPGPGGITRALLNANPKYLLLVEKDPKFKPMLNLLSDACSEHTKVDVVIEDIFNVDIQNFVQSENQVDFKNRVIIGNLPFSISTALLIKWLKIISDEMPAVERKRTKMVLTFQKEVAERIVAPILDKQRCRLSVMSQMYCNVKYPFCIPGRVFVPKPDVDVGVVVLTPLVTPLTAVPFVMVEKVLRCMFNMRQKYSLRGAENLFPEEVRSSMVMEMFENAQVDPQARPFQITTEEYARICLEYENICKKHPFVKDFDYRASKT